MAAISAADDNVILGRRGKTLKRKSEFRMHPAADRRIHLVEARSNHVFPRHSHEQYGVGLIYQGAQRSFSGRGMVEAGAGQIITVNPGEVHDGAPIDDRGRCWRMIYLDPPFVMEILAGQIDDEVRSAEFIRPVFDGDRYPALFHRLFLAMATPTTSAMPLLRDELLAELLPAAMERRTAARAVPPPVSMAQAMIDDDPAASFTLAELAAVAGLSRFQLLRGFAAALGLTPHAYLIQRRADLARRLILGGNSLADAAAASGFADQSHMTRVFIRKYGISPGDYARIRG